MGVVSLYDRRFWPTMQAAWQDGYPARAPEWSDPIEWRESARRLARRLDVKVRTGMRDGQVTAVANDGYPLGLLDPYERDEWLRQRVSE